MSSPFAVRKHDDAGSCHIAVIGEIDEDTSAGLAAFLRNAAEQDGTAELVVDLRHVTFLGAAGVRALLQGREAALTNGRAYRVINVHGISHQVLRISGLIDLLDATAPVPDNAGAAPA
ncbi:STAS domain-containing protein [Actinoplanes teichomyceticus]|uniref:Anti-sigma factor antagonist n=1 Tax=Actinoplanes teichomyceticus TaxID=1867 RepID=A0A561WBD2_ACTTI|nr:STAS domain-containing protein [Actinoplanes teichomyceticus]TWG21172.1 anti-anti-sigma factor [Actinoplanes teichomyceticus]GIF14993.1 hypothetical protein Ate01nite_50250 [Actinoplanes teichomyceticus]